MNRREAAQAYWKANRRLIAVLLLIWFVVSFGFGIIFAEELYDERIGHLPASFWWAHQGAMMVFVVIILVYALVMDRLDRKYGVGDDEGGPR
jgi:putative solute:sodium symporter small subunit